MKRTILFVLTVLSLNFILCSEPNRNYPEKIAYPKEVTKISEVQIGETLYDLVTFGTFPQSKNPEGEGFKTDPILWRVAKIENNKAFLISEKIIYGNVPFFEFYTDNRTINNQTVYSNNYEYSEIRAYLNGLSYPNVKDIETKWENKGFLQTAFTKEEQAIIAETLVDNSASQMSFNGTPYTSDRYCCNDTKDKVFLLSPKEISDPDLGFIDNSSRQKMVTDYAAANNAWYDRVKNGIWWLRSPYEQYASRGLIVLYTGEADYKTNRTRDTGTSVLPALWINLENY